MTNTNTSFVNALDCIDLALDLGFVPVNNKAVLNCSGALYRHANLPIAVFVEDVEAGSFTVRVYKLIKAYGKAHFGPKIYSTRLDNLPLKVFRRQLLGLVEDLPVM